MKKNLFLFLSILLISFTSYSQEIILNDNLNSFDVLEKSESTFTFNTSINRINYRVIKTDKGNFTKLIIPSYTSSSEIGLPEMLMLNKLISIPKGSTPIVEIISSTEKIIKLNEHQISLPILPKQPSASKGDKLEDIKFYYDEMSYEINKFTEKNLISIIHLGKMRGVDLSRLTISPFSYNPIENELKVITNLTVRISYSNIVDISDKYYSPDFNSLYKKCINYIPPSTKDIITTYPVKYIIVSDPAYQTALQPLVDWKTRKGFEVIQAYTNDPVVGNTNTSIKSFIQSFYDNASVNDPAPTYLLLVGDIDQVPSFQASGHVSDMYYCEFDGNGDFYPEMYYGRFSASSVADIEVQVAKTLTHEQYTFNDPAFLDEILLVAGVDASFAPTYGNGQINYATDNYFNIAHNLTIHNYLYGSGSPITSDQSQASSAIISNVSEGVGFANYSAHCGPSGWSDPSFNNGDVSSLQNNNEYGLMIGNCCQSAKFDEPICFGESLLRANDKGALGYIGGSNNTYWDEDYWWAVGATSSIIANPTYSGTSLGVYDCLMHENGEQKNDWFITQGQIIHSGNLAVTEAGGAEQYYWEIYHLMGDPSLMPYIGVPTTLSVNYNPVLPVGSTSLIINTEEDAYVALSENGILLDAKLCDVAGSVTLNFNPIQNVGNLDVIITKQFKQPFISTVQAISPNGPYVITSNNTVNDVFGNNNSLADYNEFIYLDLDLFNLGNSNAQNLNLVLSSIDPYVTVIDSLDLISLIGANQTISTNNTLSFQVSPFIPNQHTSIFALNISDNLGNAWTSNVNVLLNAPVFEHTNFTIDDFTLGNGNGKLDAGETLDLIVDVKNIGHADASNLLGTLGSLSTYVTVNTSSMALSFLNTNQNQNLIFNITVDQNTPVGTNVLFPFNITDQLYSYQASFSENIGIIDEDYESGDFSQFSWLHGTYPWLVDNTEIYEGIHSSRSAVSLPDNEESELSINLNVLADGDISFFKFVSSEYNFDFLKFKINGTKLDEWSGIDTGWSFVSFPVSAGLNTFKWEYDKDASQFDGLDGAWIDYIVFPAVYLAPSSNNQITSEIKIYPNPTKGIFNVSFNSSINHKIEISDMLGNTVANISSNSLSVDCDLSSLSSGSYFLKILPENIVYQIVKQ